MADVQTKNVPDSPELLTYQEAAERLRIDSCNPIRTLKTLIRKHDIATVVITYHQRMLTPEAFSALLEAMTCRSQSIDEGGRRSGKRAGRSKSAPRRSQSKGTLQEQLAEKRLKSTQTASHRNSGTKSFMVHQGGLDT